MSLQFWLVIVLTPIAFAIVVALCCMFLSIHKLEDDEQTLDEDVAETYQRLDNLEQRLSYLESIDNREK